VRAAQGVELEAAADLVLDEVLPDLELRVRGRDEHVLEVGGEALLQPQVLPPLLE